MEQRQDYTENQTGLLSQMLRRLLEKLLKIKTADVQSILSEQIALQNIDRSKELTITDLKEIEDSLLISVLMNEYGYKEENLYTLADILYETVLRSPEDYNWLRRKALLLYEHCLANLETNIHLSAFYRVRALKN